MHLPPLPLSRNSEVYIKGDVSVDPTAAIAPGVILQADSDSRIIIAADACIGTGSILHAHQGTLEVEVGANLGAGVLVIGKSKIGANACVGPLTTIFNAAIEAWEVIPAASVIGDTSRHIARLSSTESEVAQTKAPELPSPPPDTLDRRVSASSSPPAASKHRGEAPPSESPAESPTETNSSVYGQGSLDRILKTLFPYKNQSLKPASEDSED